MSKKKKYRGSGTHGGGSKKKRRGAGSRGGRGEGGEEKHRKFELEKESEKGFKRPVQSKEKTINIKELESRAPGLIDNGEAEEEGGVLKVNLSDIGYDKLLGGGKATRKMEVEAENFSQSAKEKIEEAGGKAIELS